MLLLLFMLMRVILILLTNDNIQSCVWQNCTFQLGHVPFTLGNYAADWRNIILVLSPKLYFCLFSVRSALPGSLITSQEFQNKSSVAKAELKPQLLPEVSACMSFLSWHWKLRLKWFWRTAFGAWAQFFLHKSSFPVSTAEYVRNIEFLNIYEVTFLSILSHS